METRGTTGKETTSYWFDLPIDVAEFEEDVYKRQVFDRDKDNRRFFARRSYNLYSDVQRGENVVVEIPVQAGEKHFKYEQKVKLVNPKLYGRGYAIGDMGHTDYVLVADDIVAVEEK